MTLACFKSYDIRGRVGIDLDEAVARRIGVAFASVLTPRSVIVGYDARETSPLFATAVAEGLAAQGVDVHSIGQCGTEEVYFAVPHLGADGGIMVTASHNPIDWNGMKLVGPGSRPLDQDTEFAAIREAAQHDPAPAATPGRIRPADTRGSYAAHIAGLADAGRLRTLRLLVNAGNGTAGAAFDAVLSALEANGARLDVTRLFHSPDPTFPNGIPNPLLPENRAATAEAVLAARADIGIAWDGDFDRCFFFDETGAFLDGEYVVALLAKSVLSGEPGAAIVHDPRVIWATTETVAGAGGRAIASRTGHAFLKAAMRESGAAYGGEMSAHHYFRDFFFCDSGMVPWIKILERMAESGQPLSALVADLRENFPSSGEINFRVADPVQAVAAILDRLGPEARSIDKLDGASLDFGGWRMNLRASNTEPLLRLNVEARGDRDLVRRKVAEITALIEAL